MISAKKQKKNKYEEGVRIFWAARTTKYDAFFA